MQTYSSDLSSRAETQGVEVSAVSRYHPDLSSPGRWLFSYTITIANRSAHEVQLLDRHWRITDAFGEVQEVRGAGVVGEQPVLAPGERFEYTSSCPLPTSMGTMEGIYGMIDPHGARFEVQIPKFTLIDPDSEN